MAETLFDIGFRAWNAPLEADALRTKTALEKTQVQAAQQELSNLKSMQGAMQRIWGPGGLTAASDAASDPQSADMAKLTATAKAYFGLGMVDTGNKIMQTVGTLQERSAQTARDRQATLDKQTKELGGIFGAVKDQDSETAAIQELQKRNISPQQVGLTGLYNQDQPRLQFLANSSMTRAEQMTSADRSRRLAEQDALGWARVDVMMDHVGLQARRLDQMDKAAGLAARRQDHREAEDAKHDVWHQEALKFKAGKTNANIRSNLAKVQGYEKEAAIGVFGVDDRTRDMPATLRNTYANEAAMRAKQTIADQIAHAPAGTEYEQEDFDAALAAEMDKMEAGGLFKRKDDGGWFGSPQYKYKGQPTEQRGAPARTAPGGPPPLPPQVKTTADYDKISPGSTYMDPDGNIRTKPKKGGK